MRLLEVAGAPPDSGRNWDLTGFRDERQLNVNVPDAPGRTYVPPGRSSTTPA